MKAAFIVSAVTSLAMGAMAAPEPVAGWPQPAPSPVPSCSTTQKTACCNNPSGLTLISASVCSLVDIGSCSGADTFCCTTDQTGFINLNIQCVKLL